MKYPVTNIFMKEQQRLKIFPFFLFTPTPPPQCSFGVNQELIEHHKMRRRKASPPLIIWKSPRELTVADPGKGAPPYFLTKRRENFFETAPSLISGSR